MNKNKGFTLLELLVVIAIIGILTTVVIASLSNSRAKATLTSAHSTVVSILPHAVTCMDEGSILGPINSTTVGGGYICETTVSKWPELVVGWSYTDLDSDNTPTSNPGLATFSFTVSDKIGNFITCDETNGCVDTLVQ